jgi:hypothetical protein
MNLDPAWRPTGRIALKQALMLPLSSLRCFVYNIDLIGESYIGKTCQSVGQASCGDDSLSHLC